MPIEPKLTPGWGVAGVLLLATGAGYALIGIKNQWLHTFLSAAYLGALGTTILIVYLMTLPVSNGVQGAYVVAAVLTGAILGGVSCIFKEITEALGSMLGGFCFSMWLLTLADGGLVKETGSKAIFIAVFTAASFATYFSQYTRAHGLITSIAFSGATVVILGVDCFSQAGLKEFWAYIWELNEDLVPVDIDTFPITKGMKAETAIIIIIFLVGIVSQMKLWKVINEHREKHAAKRAAHQRDLQAEEEAVGRQIEEQTMRDRREWEAVYGNGEQPSSNVSQSGDSGVETGMNEKKTARESNSLSHKPVEIEMTNISPAEEAPVASPKPKTAAETVTEVIKDGTVTVRVAADDMPNRPDDVEEANQTSVWAVGSDGNPVPASGSARGISRSLTPAPIVVPLPFRVPQAEGEEEMQSMVGHSSIATFDGEGDELAPPSRRQSMAKRISQNSLTLLRRMSQRTTKPESQCSTKREHSMSHEELVISRNDMEQDRRSSLAATIDGMSSVGESASTRDGRPISIEVKAELANRTISDKSCVDNMDKACEEQPNTKTSRALSEERPLSGASLGPSDAVDEKISAIGRPSSYLEVGTPKHPKSVLSETSTRASLTQGRLPRSLSRVAMSYRTNEWAKHLSHADTPAPDSLQLNEYPPEPIAEETIEASVPVNVDELVQTAKNGAPPPAQPISTMANVSYGGMARSLSHGSQNSPAPVAGTRLVSNPHRISTDVLNQPIVEEGPRETIARPEADVGIPSARTSISIERPPIPGVVSYSSPQTLIGQREMLMRNKSALSVSGIPAPALERTGSDIGSLPNYPVYSVYNGSIPSQTMEGADDLPLSQRRELMMRQTSLQALGGGVSRPSSAIPGTMGSFPAAAISAPTLATDTIPFNSHQPQRDSGIQSQAAREARMASFRQSVAQDLRNGSTLAPTQVSTSNPYANGTLLGGGLMGGSMTSLRNPRDCEAGVRYSINASRTNLLSQKHNEFAQKEAERLNREKQNRIFEQRMRSGELLDAHRDAMRRLQNASRAD